MVGSSRHSPVRQARASKKGLSWASGPAHQAWKKVASSHFKILPAGPNGSTPISPQRLVRVLAPAEARRGMGGIFLIPIGQATAAVARASASPDAPVTSPTCLSVMQIGS